MTKKASNQHSGTTSVPKKKEKQDEAIIGTNDYSIVSKRSVEKIYYPHEPQFLRPFVGKFKRRAPLINRGYWLRMKAIEHVIKTFLDEPAAKSKVIINLGCGYEPLPFKMMWKHKSQCRNVKFVDIDFPQLIERKLQIIRANTIFTDLLDDFGEKVLSSLPDSILFDDEHYCAVGCDLGDISRMRDILSTKLKLERHAILFLAQVSMVYMEPNEATNLIGICREFEDGGQFRHS
jgi:tRNA wybutosine-synthesizing protein 4